MADVETTVDGPLLTLRLNRPDKKNALTSAMYGALADGLARLEEDDDLRAGLLLAEGRDFCAGNDLFDFAAPAARGDEGDTELPVARFLRALPSATKPLLAAVRGRAIGVGATLLLHFDLVAVAPDADIRFPFVDLGLVPEAGSTLLLPALVGHRRAAEILLLGRPLDAGRAVELGIATTVSDDPDATVAGWAAALAAKPVAGLLATRRLLRGDPEVILARQAVEGRVFAELLAGPEFAAALARFGGPRPDPAG